MSIRNKYSNISCRILIFFRFLVWFLTYWDSIDQVGTLSPEKSIPVAVLKQARGLAILTVAKVGVMMTYNVGTGLVVARREDGSWSPPSAISSFGVGWGAQV